MIGILQRKFILAAMTAISVLILLMIGAINIVNLVVTDGQISDALRVICENLENPEKIPKTPENGSPPFQLRPPDERDVFLSSDFFVVCINDEGETVFSDTGRIASLDEEEAAALASRIFENGKAEGIMGRYRYVMQSSRNKSGTEIIGLDISGEIYACIQVLLVSAGIGVVCWSAMLLLVILLSKKAIHPIAVNMEKQKQFVTNAGHEIKTPLAIIQSNTEAMELYQGENKWSRNIKEQTARLNDLIKNLLVLARMDENTVVQHMTELSLSQLLEETVKTFMESFCIRGISVRTEIPSSVTVRADREYMAQLISILLDNARKYTDENGMVFIRLEKNDRKTNLQISNTCSQLPPVSPERLFDRFYRGDEARTQKSGGYGIGLSVAKSIVESLRGTLTAEYRNGNTIIFTVRL